MAGRPALDVDTTPLAAAGFARGWSPSSMTARALDVAPVGDPRIEIQEQSPAHAGTEDPGYCAELAMAADRPKHSWYAGSKRLFAGHAWSHLSGETAGVFDLAVWPRFRRQGIATGLLRSVCAAARAAGAGEFVLNATADGKPVYERNGLTQIGEGITWWLHRANLTALPND